MAVRAARTRRRTARGAPPASRRAAAARDFGRCERAPSLLRRGAATESAHSATGLRHPRWATATRTPRRPRSTGRRTPGRPGSRTSPAHRARARHADLADRPRRGRQVRVRVQPGRPGGRRRDPAHPVALPLRPPAPVRASPRPAWPRCSSTEISRAYARAMSTQYELYVAGRAASRPPAGASTRRSIRTRASRGRGCPTPARRTSTARSRAARAAFEGEWGAQTGFERSRLMHRLADVIERDADRLAELESRDSRQAPARVQRADAAAAVVVPLLRGLGGQARGRVASRPTSRTSSTFTQRVPVGVVAAVVPWNSPLLAADLEARPGARDRLHDGGQAERSHAGDGAGARQAW